MPDSDLDYCKIVGRIGLTVGDGPDAGEYPDIMRPAPGATVTFEPQRKFVKADGSTPPETLGKANTVCWIDPEGYLTYPEPVEDEAGNVTYGNRYVWLVDLGSDKVNPTLPRNKAAYKATFKNVSFNGTTVEFPSFTFHPLPGVDNDLTLLAPVPVGGGQAIVVGPQGETGRGIEMAAVDGDRLVLTYTDDSTEDVGNVRGPLGPGGAAGAKGDPGLPATNAAENDANLGTLLKTTGTQGRAGVVQSSPKAAAHVPVPLDTYDGNPSVGHFDVVTVPAGWNGWKHWMAYTPFPDILRENPCIAVSNDGYTWTTPAGLTNPVVPFSALPAGYDWWSDTDMVLSHDGTTMMMYFRGTNQGVTNTCYLTTSTNGVNWTPFEQVIDPVEESPAVITEPGGGFTMYTSSGGQIFRRTSADGKVWSARTTCTNPTLPTPFNIWHIDVIKRNGVYMALVDASTPTGGPTPYRLYLWTSTNGTAFTGPTTPAVPLSGTRFDKRGHYRSTLQPALSGHPDRYDVWTTCMDDTLNDHNSAIWRLGYIRDFDFRDGNTWNFPELAERILVEDDGLTAPVYATEMHAYDISAGQDKPPLALTRVHTVPARALRKAALGDTISATLGPFPREWTHVTIEVEVCTASTNVGNAVLQTKHQVFGPNDRILPLTDAGNPTSTFRQPTVTVAAKDVPVWSDAIQYPVVSPTRIRPGQQINIQFVRVGGNGGDTLVDTLYVLAVRVRRVRRHIA